MEWDGILRGGPFLEVSFILEYQDLPRNQFVDAKIKNLLKLSTPFEFCTHNLDELIENFHKGYLDDDTNSNSIRYHHTQIPICFEFPEKRKSILYIDEIGPQTVQFDFVFFGSNFDAPEWDQIGIIKEDLSKFRVFFEDLFLIFQFQLGAIGCEADCLLLFENKNYYPHESYRIEYFKQQINTKGQIQEDRWMEYLLVRWNGTDLKENFLHW